MKWIKVALIVIGLGHVLWGAIKLRSAGPKKPVTVKLAEIEAGNRPKSNYWRVTDYYSRTDKTVVETLTSESSVISKRYYYPILSGKRPAIEPPDVGNFAVLVYAPETRDLKGVDKPMEGVVGVGLLSISSQMRSELDDMFPNVEADKVILFRKGKKPQTSIIYWIILGFGVVLMIGGVWLIFDQRD